LHHFTATQNQFQAKPVAFPPLAHQAKVIKDLIGIEWGKAIHLIPKYLA
jgi:hypothetical protein